MLKNKIFKLGEWTVHPLSGNLQRGEQTEHIQPKSMDVLMCLMQHAPDVVERETVLHEVWGANAVTDEPLTRCIAELRRKLGDQRANPSYIGTIPKRGYRLLIEATEVETVNRQASTPAPSEPQAQFQQVPDRSIAVLPFADISENADLTYLAEGIAEEIMQTLAQVVDLKVAARLSTVSLRNEDYQTIRATLGVRFVLEGSVMRQADLVKVNVRMTDTNDGIQRLAESFEEQGQKLLTLQKNLAHRIFSALPDSLVDQSLPDWRSLESPETEAVDLYLKGRYALNQRNLPAAADYLQKACDLGGDFASLYKAYATVLAILPLYYLSNNPKATLIEASNYAERALKIEPNSAQARSVLGMVSMLRHQWQDAANHFRTAIRDNPREPIARQWYGTLQMLRGRPAVAMEHYEIVRQIDPISPVVFRDMGLAHWASGDYEEAENFLLLGRSLTESDGRSWIPTILGAIYLDQGRYEEAFQELQRDQFLAKLDAEELQSLMEAIVRFKTENQASALVEQFEARIPTPMLSARLYALTGNDQRAIASLRRGFQDADALITLSYVDPALERLRNSPQGKLLFIPIPDDE